MTILIDPITGSQEGREVAAYLTGPIVPGQVSRFALAVEAAVRNGRAHEPRLARIPSPTDAISSEYGVQHSGGFSAEITAADLDVIGAAADGYWDGYSLLSQYGESPAAFTRNLPIPVPDHESIYRWTLPNEFAPAAGCRRDHNLLSDTDVLATQSIAVAAGTHILVLGKCTGSITLSGAATGMLVGSAANRKQLIVTTTAGSLTLTVTGTVSQAMLLPMQGASHLVAPEYVPHSSTSVWPHNGFGVRGVVWRRTANANTVDGSGNITDVPPQMQRQAWLALPGRAGNFATTPNATADQIAGDIELVARVMPSAAIGTMTLISASYAGAGVDTNFLWQYDLANNRCVYYWAVGASLHVVVSTAITQTPGAIWLRLRHTVNDGAGNRVIAFAQSHNGVDWSDISTSTAAAGVGARNPGTGTWRIGAFDAAGTLDLFGGKIYYAVARGGIGGAAVVEFDPSRIAAAAVQGVMVTGETWTINQSGAGNVARVAEAHTDASQLPYRHDPAQTQLVTAEINSWAEIGTTTPTAAAGPDGLLSGWTLTDNDAAASEYRYFYVTVPADSRARAIMVMVAKDAITSRFVGVSMQHIGGAANCVHINSATGAYVQEAGSVGTVSVVDVGAYWQVRQSQVNNGTSTTLRVSLIPAIGTVLGTPNAAAVGSATFAWPMLVVGDRCENFITPAAGVRNTSALDFPALLSNAEGAVYIEHRPEWLGEPGVVYCVAAQAAGVNGVYAYSISGNIYAFDGANSPNGGALTLGVNRSVVGWSGDSARMYLDGAAQAGDNYTGDWGGGNFCVGHRGGGSEPMQGGSLGPLKWFRRRPPSQQLAALNSAPEPFGRGQFEWLRDNIRGTTWELVLVSTLARANAAVLSLTDTRRGVARRVSVSKNKLQIQFTDIDTAALDRVYPFLRYTKEQLPNINAAHIGRVAADCSAGVIEKIPLAYINTNGTNIFTFAICEKRASTTYTVNTIYRDGRIVTASEYTVGVSTMADGTQLVSITFAREQRDTSGRQYEFSADITVTGDASPSAEIQRLLIRASIPVDTASFTAAITEDAARGFTIAAGYTQETKLKSIIEDLLFVARADLAKTDSGAWAITQDKLRTSVATVREADGLIDVDVVEEPMPPQAYELKYRPRAPGGTDWQFTAQRAGTGTGEVRRLVNPYIYDGAVADRLIDYISKRDNGLRTARMTLWGAMFENGDALTVDGVSCWRGQREWLIRGVERPVDANQITARQYDASIYTYTPGTIPAGATNGYAPDYSQTPPTAPTALTYVSGSSGTSIAVDGVARAHMAYTAAPPAVNAARIMFAATDASGAIARVEGKRNGAVFEGVLTGLRPGVSHTVQAYAINANGIDGTVVSEVRASPGYAVVPATPGATASTTQVGTAKLRFDFSPSTSPNIAYYEARFSNDSVNFGANIKFGTSSVEGSFSNAAVAAGFGYADIRAVDTFGNVSAWRGIFSGAIGRWVNDNNIISGGVNTPSLGNGAITQSRTNTSVGFAAYLVPAGGALNIGLSKYAFAPSLVSFGDLIGGTGALVYLMASTDITKAGGADVSRLRLKNDAATESNVQADYRIFNP
jgi:hypothetical protein